jgi:predicted DNA-binding transcriptional regulator AlpA
MNYINFQQLQSKLGNRSRSAIYVDLEIGRLPQPIKMGRRSYWREHEVDQHIQSLQDGQND